MLPDRVSNPGPLTYESGAQPIALRGPAKSFVSSIKFIYAVFLQLAEERQLVMMLSTSNRVPRLLNFFHAQLS